MHQALKMAEKPDCQVCKEPKELTALPCQHTLCTECVEKIKEDGVLSCPSCRKKYKVDTQGFQHLPNQLKPSDSVKKAEAVPQGCPEHFGSELKFYCKQCKVLVCPMCFVLEHNGHKFGTDTSKDLKADIEDLLKETKLPLVRAQEHLKYVEMVEQKTMSRSREIKSDIEKHFDPIIKALKEQRDSLLFKAEEDCNNDNKEIWKRHETLEEGITKYNKAMEAASTLLEATDEQKILRDGPAVIKDLQQIMKLGLDPKDTEVLETKFRHFKPGPQLNLETQSDVIRSDSEPKIEITCCDLPPAKVHLKDKVAFKVKVSLKADIRELEKKPVCKPTVIITHGHNKIAIPIAPAIEKLDDEWLVTFSPVVAGTHTIAVSAKTDFAQKELSEMSEMTLKVKNKNSIECGDKVVPGPDWKEESIIGLEGEVVDTKDSGEVTVQWRSGKKYYYKWGLNGMYEVQLATKEDRV